MNNQELKELLKSQKSLIQKIIYINEKILRLVRDSDVEVIDFPESLEILKFQEIIKEKGLQDVISASWVASVVEKRLVRKKVMNGLGYISVVVRDPDNSVIRVWKKSTI